MPEDTQARRLTPAASSAASAAVTVATATPSVVTLLARPARLIDLLPHLHQHALSATGAARSLLFEHNPRNGALQATSGFGLDALPVDPWVPAEPEGSLVADAFASGQAVLVADARRRMPDLAARLAARSVLLLPLMRAGDRIGLLTVGYDEASPRMSDRAAVVADTFLTAIELSRLRQNSELQRDLQHLFDQFVQTVSTTPQVAAALDRLCAGLTPLLGADRTSVWLYDRRARTLALYATSDRTHGSRGVPVAADDPLSPAAGALRRNRAELTSSLQDSATAMLTIPLRGWRRALGTVVVDGVRVEPGGELDLLDRADEVGRQLANAIETQQLLDDVLRSRRELVNTLDSIAHLVVVTDSAGRIVHSNKAFARRINRPSEELVEQPIAEFVGAELGEWLAEVRNEPAGGPAATRRELVSGALNGSFEITATGLGGSEQQRVGTVIVARDLTPQTQLAAEHEDLRHRLVQSEKLAALGQLVAGIAHELNNPLQGVLGHLELLRASGAFPPRVQREVRTIYREADRAAKIVRNLLVFAGSGRVGRRAVNLKTVLQKVVASRARSCRAASIEIVRHYDETVPRVQSDPLLLHQVFLNMVMNAEQAVASTSRPGRIEIGITADRERQVVVTTLHDTGPGIAPDALKHLFEPFYTTKDVGQGTGLGLAIAYGIVQDHGGAIHAANHPDGGALFTVELPILDAPVRGQAGHR